MTTTTTTNTTCFNVLSAALVAFENRSDCVYFDKGTIDTELLITSIQGVNEDMAKGVEVTQALADRYLPITDEVVGAFMVGVDTSLAPAQQNKAGIKALIMSKRVEAMRNYPDDADTVNEVCNKALAVVEGSDSVDVTGLLVSIDDEIYQALGEDEDESVEEQSAADRNNPESVAELLEATLEPKLKKFRSAAKKDVVRSVLASLVEEVKSGDMKAKEGLTLLKTAYDELESRIVSGVEALASAPKPNPHAEQEADLKAKVDAVREAFVNRVAAAKEGAQDDYQYQVYGVTVNEFLSVQSYLGNREVEGREKEAHLNGEQHTKHDNQRAVAVFLLDKERNADLWAREEAYAAEKGEVSTLPLVKGDGHSRSHSWSIFKDGEHVLSHPENLVMTVHYGLTDEQYDQLVKDYGGKAQTITSKQAADMARKKLMIRAKSELIKKPWKSAFSVADNSYSTEEAGVAACINEMLWLDTLNLKDRYTRKDEKHLTGLTSSGVKSGFLDTFQIAKALEVGEQVVHSFWLDFFAPVKGEKSIIEQVRVIQNEIEDAVKNGRNHGNKYDKPLNKLIRDEFTKYVNAVKKVSAAA